MAYPYDHRWDRARRYWLAEHPLCVECERTGHLTSAGVVDHVIPHAGNMMLFWSRDNWQSLCIQCHNSKSARELHGLLQKGVGSDGLPLQRM